MNFIKRKRIKEWSLFIHAIILSLICNEILFSMNAAARESIAFGEMKSEGKVQIQSSRETWVDLQEIYPLLKNTKVRTCDGIVFITVKEGSRIDLSRDTEVIIDSKDGDYTVSLIQGAVSFNITPSSSIGIITKDVNISVTRQVGDYYSLTAGTGAPALPNIQGMVFRNNQGILIRAISGRIHVNIKGLEAKVLNSGESYFVSLEGNEAPLVRDPAEAGKNTRLYQYLIGGAFFISGGVVAYETFRGHGVHSRSGF